MVIVIIEMTFVYLKLTELLVCKLIQKFFWNEMDMTPLCWKAVFQMKLG